MLLRTALGGNVSERLIRVGDRPAVAVDDGATFGRQDLGVLTLLGGFGRQGSASITCTYTIRMATTITARTMTTPAILARKANPPVPVGFSPRPGPIGPPGPFRRTRRGRCRPRPWPTGLPARGRTTARTAARSDTGPIRGGSCHGYSLSIRSTRLPRISVRRVAHCRQTGQSAGHWARVSAGRWVRECSWMSRTPVATASSAAHPTYRLSRSGLARYGFDRSGFDRSGLVRSLRRRRARSNHRPWSCRSSRADPRSWWRR